MASAACDDDIFDEEGDEGEFFKNQWRKIESARQKDGYREGLAKGQDDVLQQAFNAGFKAASTRSYKAAKLRGILSAYLGYQLIAASPETQITDKHKHDMEILIEELSDLERQLQSSSREEMPCSDRDPKESGLARDSTNNLEGGERTDSCCSGGDTSSKSDCRCFTESETQRKACSHRNSGNLCHASQRTDSMESKPAHNEHSDEFDGKFSVIERRCKDLLHELNLSELLQ